MKTDKWIYPSLGLHQYLIPCIHCNWCDVRLSSGLGNEYADSLGELRLAARVNDWYVKDNLYLCNNCNRWWKRWAIKMKEFFLVV